MSGSRLSNSPAAPLIALFPMSEFEPAVAKTLAAEGGFCHDPETGEYCNFGISVWFLRSVGILHGSGPASSGEIAFLQSMTQDYAISLYRTHFWNPLHATWLNNQQLANKVFDLAVNMGVYPAVKLLQQALNEVTLGNYAVDGVLGPITGQACNIADISKLYPAYLRQAEARYRQIAQSPELAHDLKGWLARLYS